MTSPDAATLRIGPSSLQRKALTIPPHVDSVGPAERGAEAMNKNGLIAEVSKRTGSSKAETGRAIDAAMDVIRESVAKGDRVSLVGFGTFERKRRNKRIARNPRKPETPIVVPARDLPWFTAGKEFKDMVTAKRRRTAAKR
jgi:DNA-binding protein HU-beta